MRSPPSSWLRWPPPRLGSRSGPPAAGGRAAGAGSRGGPGRAARKRHEAPEPLCSPRALRAIIFATDVSTMKKSVAGTHVVRCNLTSTTPEAGIPCPRTAPESNRRQFTDAGRPGVLRSRSCPNEGLCLGVGATSTARWMPPIQSVDPGTSRIPSQFNPTPDSPSACPPQCWLHDTRKHGHLDHLECRLTEVSLPPRCVPADHGVGRLLCRARAVGLWRNRPPP